MTRGKVRKAKQSGRPIGKGQRTEAQRKARTAKRKPVLLDSILEVLYTQTDEWCSCLDRETGEMVHVTRDARNAANRGDTPRYSTDWEQEMFDLARQIAEDDGRFVELPQQDGQDAWQMMADFAEAIQDAHQQGEIEYAIRGRGAFQNFRDTIQHLGLDQAWGTFEEQQYKQVARDWCREHRITVKRQHRHPCHIAEPD